MTEHIRKNDMVAFVAGTVDEDLAVRIAEHLDGCIECSARAASLEPLSLAFASVDAPEAPEHLVPAVIAALEAPEHAPAAEIVVGAVMLAAASVLVLAAGNPLAFLVELGMFAKLAAGIGGALSVGVGSSTLLTSAVLAIAFFGCLAVARLTEPTQPVQLAEPQLTTNW